MMDLYISPAETFEKSAAEVALPEDANAWPTELLQELYKQVPYVSDFDPQVVMDKVDAERGYGFGHVEIQNKSEAQQGLPEDAKRQIGIQQVRVPVIIRDRKLQPFDVLVTSDSKALPLTEKRLRQALFRPQAFDVTGRTPGDMSMVGQLYPPYRQNYGFGGGGMVGQAGMGKESSGDHARPGDFLHENSQSLQLEAKHFGPDGAKLQPHPSGPRHWKIDHEGRLHPHTPAQKTASRTTVSTREQIWKEAAAQGGEFPTQDHFHAKLEQVLGLTPEDVAKLKGQKTASAPIAGAAPVPSTNTVKGIVPNMSQSMKTGSILSAILPTINVTDYVTFTERFDPGLRAAYTKNASATHAALQSLLSFNPDADQWAKTAGVLHNLKPSVVQIRKEAEGYSVKQASHLAWKPVVETMDRGGVVRTFGEKVALAADLSGSVTLTDGDGASASPEENRAEVVSGYGFYKVKSIDGQDLMGFVFPNLYDVDGSSLPIALFTDGAHAAVQDAIAGERITGDVPELSLGDEPQGHGCFVRLLDGSAEATIPYTVKAGYASGAAQQYQVETYDGREMMLSVQSGGSLKVPTQIDDVCLIPSDYSWMPLGDKGDVELVREVSGFGQQKEASQSLASVMVRAGGENNFTLDSWHLRKIANEDRSFISLDDTLFYLGGLGVNLDYAAEKLAEALASRTPVKVKIGRVITPLADALDGATQAYAEKVASLPNLRCDLVKEAAFLPDPTAVDTVLSLGFINPENLTTFIGFLPQIDTVQSKLCELLIAARLGLTDVPSTSLEKTVKSLEDTIDGLKTVAFTRS